MMKRLLAASLFLALSCFQALASDCWGNVAGTQANCGSVQMYLNASGQSVPMTGAMPTGGEVASGAADSGNPVKIGTTVFTGGTLPVFSDGVRANAMSDTRGRLFITAFSPLFTGLDAFANTGLVGAQGQGDLATNVRLLLNAPMVFNGSTWDRQFTCPNTAVVNVTAAATTEIVALTASQIIRVCSVAISMSAAGTAKFVSGTGTNCGTGTADVTGALPLATGTPLAISSGNGSVFRSPSANALCVTAATGNVVGFVTYAKY